MNWFSRSGSGQGTQGMTPAGPTGPRVGPAPRHHYSSSVPSVQSAPFPHGAGATSPNANVNTNINSNPNGNAYANVNVSPNNINGSPINPNMNANVNTNPNHNPLEWSRRSPPLQPQVQGQGQGFVTPPGTGNRPHPSWGDPSQAQGATQQQYHQYQGHQYPLQHAQQQQQQQHQQQPQYQQQQQHQQNAAFGRTTSPGIQGTPQRALSNASPIASANTPPWASPHANASTTTVSTVGRDSTSTGESIPPGGGTGLRTIHERYEQRFMYLYNATIGAMEVQFILTVEAAPLTPDESVVTLTFKSGGIERSLCGKEYMRLHVDPSTLHFHIFIFPKPSLPADCLYCVRVWLESQQVQHRIFSDENLWVGKDPPFSAIPHVALTQFGPPATPFTNRNEIGVTRRAYKGFVGRAACDFVIIMKNLSAPDSVWGISMEYQSGGVSRLVFEQVKLRFHCRPDDVKFVIYVPIDSSIPYSNHRLRVWVKGLDGVHHRLFKSDEFRIGGQLAFEPLAHGPGNVVFARRDQSSPTVALHSSLLHSEPPKGALENFGASTSSASSLGYSGIGSTSLMRNNSERAGTITGIGTGSGTGGARVGGAARSSGDAGAGRGRLDDDRALTEYEERRMGISIGIGNSGASGSGSGSGAGNGSGANLPFDESLPPSYSAVLGVGI